MTLSLSIIKDLRSSFLTFTPKNSQFLKPQNLLQLLLTSICFSPEIKVTNIATKLYDKHDAFGFNIVNFPFISSNIPSAPAYGVYASQLICYAHCCSSYSDLLLRHSVLVTRVLSQGYKVNRLSNTFKKSMADTLIWLDNTRKISAKCLLILSVEMIFIFDGYAYGPINKIS